MDAGGDREEQPAGETLQNKAPTFLVDSWLLGELARRHDLNFSSVALFSSRFGTLC